MATQIPKSEKLVSFLLLVGLAGIVVGVFAGAFSPKPAVEEKVRASYPLPPGWKIAGKWETYPDGKLYEKIDGRETLFQSFGVIRLDFAPVVFNENKFDVYLYHMRNPDGALGVFLDSSPEQTGEINLVSMTNVAGGELRAFQSSVYLEIQAQEKSFDEKLLRQLAKSLLSGIKPPISSGTSLFDLLPKSGRITGSLAYNKESALGLKSLAGSYSASYLENGRQIDYVVRKISGSDGTKILEKVRSELMEFEGKIIEFKPDRLAGEILGKKLFLVLHDQVLLGAYGEEVNWKTLVRNSGKPNP